MTLLYNVLIRNVLFYVQSRILVIDEFGGEFYEQT